MLVQDLGQLDAILPLDLGPQVHCSRVQLIAVELREAMRKVQNGEGDADSCAARDVRVDGNFERVRSHDGAVAIRVDRLQDNII